MSRPFRSNTQPGCLSKVVAIGSNRPGEDTQIWDRPLIQTPGDIDSVTPDTPKFNG